MQTLRKKTKLKRGNNIYILKKLFKKNSITACGCVSLPNGPAAVNQHVNC